MTRLIKWIGFFLLFINAVNATTPSWYSRTPEQEVKINVLLFLSSSCPHCQQAESFFNELGKTSSDINITKYFINQDKDALFLFNQLLNEEHVDDFSVPSIYFCNSRWVGFSDTQSTGKDLVRAIQYCKAQIEKEGRLTEGTVETLKHWAYANRFDSGMIEKPSPWRYIVSVAFLDAVSPCAFFIIICFLAVIGVAKDKKMACWGGCLFLFSMMLMRYFQQAETSFFYHLLPGLRLPALIIGLLGLWFVYKNIFSFVAEKKQEIIYWILAVVLGCLITAYQQTCVMNWAYVYQQWFNNQAFPSFHATFYQVLYQLVYVLPTLICGVIYFFAFPRLRFLSFLMLGFCCLLLVIFPQALSLLWVSMVVIGLSLLGNYLFKRGLIFGG